MEKKEKIILLPKIFDPRGSLTVTEEMKNIPFHIHRVEYLYGICQGKELEKYTEKESYKFYVALSGSFRITIQEDDDTKRDYMLNRPYQECSSRVTPTTPFTISPTEWSVWK